MADLQLYHHGIKGQRWGVRRFQNKDGTLTAAGKKRRYSDDPILKKQKEDMKSAKATRKASAKAADKASNRYQLVPTTTNYNNWREAADKYKTDDLAYKRSKLAYTTNKEVARIRDNDVEFKNKSKHRLRLEDQYKKMGMTAEQAQAAANNRIRTERIVAASAALTVAACATYIAVKKRKNRIDGVIKAGEKLQRVEMTNTDGKLHDVFYASKDKKDNVRYERMLGFARKKATGEAYLMELSAKSDVRVASRDKAIKTFSDLYKNDADFRKSVQPYVGNHYRVDNKVADTSKLSRRNLQKMYDNFNVGLVRMRDDGVTADKTFYDKLKSAGYGAIQDMNDMKYSGYDVKNPLIVFDNSKGNIMVKSVKEITNPSGKDATIEMLKATGEHLTRRTVDKYGPLTAAGLTATAGYMYVSDPTKQYNDTSTQKVSK